MQTNSDIVACREHSADSLVRESFRHTNILTYCVSSVVLIQQPPVRHSYGVPVRHFFAFNSGHHRDSEPVYSQTSNKPLQNNH